ncbi:MAG: phosphate ABC transporter permease PstA [Planctomycetes bacterium]|nr:phosphate ABC transporter permease PstA [Planctomycetota bacterium]
MAGNGVSSGGRLWIALSGLSLVLILAMMGILFLLIGVNSVQALWPSRLERVVVDGGSEFLGLPVNADVAPDGRRRVQYKVGNRELNAMADFRWIDADSRSQRDYPTEAVRVERLENGDLYGFLVGITDAAGAVQAMTPEAFIHTLRDYRERWNREAEPLRRRLAALGDRWQETNLAALKAAYQLENADPAERSRWEDRLVEYRSREQAIKDDSEALMAEFNLIRADFLRERAAFTTADGTEVVLPLAAVVDVTWPNRMTTTEKIRRLLTNTWNLLSQYPREANTEGGLFPALFGTAMLVFLMAISAFPLGVAAGIYLREYARDGILSRTARIAVNNLAGVPSIVYGIFGLGFFIYGLGGGIDRLLFPERVAAGIATFGGGGIIWSSLTLGLLTLPVVIVATEEALATVPSEVRQGSLALGATRFQTLWRVVLPMASPGILTGFILAMARAAGEVAPLMLTGAVKSAHNLPLDTNWPFVHLERKFMHLGFHIYDMGFQSPNVEASKPLVYLTALVLLVLVFVLNITAITLRKRMRDKYAMRGF